MYLRPCGYCPSRRVRLWPNRVRTAMSVYPLYPRAAGTNTAGAEGVKGRWRYDEKTCTLIPIADDAVHYSDITEAERQLKAHEERKGDDAGHPGTYA